MLISTVTGYLRAFLLPVLFDKTIASSPEWQSEYDVESWRNDGYRDPLESYRFEKPITFAGSISPETEAKIVTRLSTFGEHPAGFGKFTRTMVTQDMRRLLDRVPSRYRGMLEVFL